MPNGLTEKPGHGPATHHARTAIHAVCSLVALQTFLVTAPIRAAESASEDAFRRRFEKLAKNGLLLVSAESTAPTLVASVRSGRVLPEFLSTEDITLVVKQHMDEIRACYERALDGPTPGWSGAAILDISIRRTGRVSEVSLDPEGLRTAKLGQCILRSAAKWRFPEFTGESEEGVTREVVNASIPLRFAPPAN